MFKGHPKELTSLALTELCERFTYYGIGNLLVLYLVKEYHATAEHAAHVYGIFMGISYFIPLLGGFIADRWNYHHPVIFGTILNAIGTFIIAIGHPLMLHIGLGCVALGYGLFTPSITTLLGYTYHDRAQLREAGFSIYYSAANLGVFLAMISLGWIAQTFSWKIAFIVSGCVQLLGLIPMFSYIRNHHVKYKDLHPRHMKKVGVTDQLLSKQQRDRMVVIIVLILFSIVFWMPYSQGASSMSIFALNFTNRKIFNFEMPASWILSSESLFLILLAPVLASLYGYLQKIHRDPSPVVKTALSLFSMAICFCIMIFASRHIPPHATEANIFFLMPIIAYLFMAIGEMLLAPIGLSLISNIAPRRHTALLIGLWYVCVAIAFYIGGLFAGLVEKIPSLYDFFSIFVFVTAIPGLILLMLSKLLNRMSHKDWKPE